MSERRSGQNAELLWLACAAWNERGIEDFLQYLDADVEWHPPAESMEPGVYRGHAGVRDYLGRLGEVFDERHIEPVEVVELAADVVLATIRMYGRSEQFGTEVDTTWAWLVTVRDGKGKRIESFLQKDEALRAYERVPPGALS